VGIVNRIQNAWTRLQQFNPNTLQLIAADGYKTTVNARGGQDYVVRLPTAGSIIGVYVRLATVDQAVSTTPVTVNTDLLVGDAGGIMSYAAGEFTVLKAASFSLLAELNLLQLQNNSISYVWLDINGVRGTWSGTVADIGNAGISDNPQVNLLYYPLAVGDKIRMRAVTSLSNGVRVDAVPDDGVHGGVPGVRMSFTAFLRVDP
jgi:hypothetical protein